MSRELIERLREPHVEVGRESVGGVIDTLRDAMNEAADVIERQDILIKEMAATLQNMALSLSNEDTEE